MRAKKYADDYRLENVLDAGGKMRTVSVYKGQRFSFLAGEGEIRREKTLFPLLTALLLAVVLVPLFLRAASMHLWYVSVPAVLSLLPVWMLLTSCWTLLFVKPPFTREQNDRLHERVAPWSLVQMFLSLFCLVGQIVFLAGGAWGGTDLIVGASALVAFVLALLLFLRKKRLLTMALPEESEGADVLPAGKDAASDRPADGDDIH